VATSPEGAAAPRAGGAFSVRLEQFEGPFDLLLSLIAQRKLDVTELSLAAVTDDFIAHIRAHEDWDLSLASDFVLVAATLLEIKAARLLPQGELEDPEDLALLEARDLLFARLLQYRAFKEAAAVLGARLADQARWRPRAVPLEPQLAKVLPDLVWALGPEDLARLAAGALSRPAAPPEVATAHLHAARVSMAAQAKVVAGRLRRAGGATFRALVSDAAGDLGVVVARFLALLELYRRGLVAFEQAEALGELTARWAGPDGAEEFDFAELDGQQDGPAQGGGEAER
jgi:segregation and condensation protein A